MYALTQHYTTAYYNTVTAAKFTALLVDELLRVGTAKSPSTACHSVMLYMYSTTVLTYSTSETSFCLLEIPCSSVEQLSYSYPSGLQEYQFYGYLQSLQTSSVNTPRMSVKKQSEDNCNKTKPDPCL